MNPTKSHGILHGTQPQHLAVASAFILLAVRLFRLVEQYSVNILFGDQWQFDEATLFQNHSWLEIFRWQHGPHRQGLGGILSKLFEPLIQWNSRYEAFAIAGIICLACLAALWLKQRLFGKISYADVAIPLLFLTPIQYQVLLETPNPSHGPLPLLLVVLYCLAWTIRTERRKYLAVLVLNFLLTYTAFGLFMGFLTPVFIAVHFWTHRQWPRLNVAALTISMVSLASFFVGWRYEPAIDCFSPHPHNPLRYLLFVAFMLATFIGVFVRQQLVPAILAGSFLLLIFSVVFGNFIRRSWKEKAARQPDFTVLILLSYSLVFAFATAYGRVCIGLSQAQESRYSTYLILAFLGLYLGALSTKTKLERNVFTVLIVGLALASSFPVRGSQRGAMAELRDHKTAWRDCYLSGKGIEECDLETHFAINSSLEPPDLQSKLDYLQRRRLNLFAGLTVLPSERGVPISPMQ